MVYLIWYRCSTSYKYLWENYSNFNECKSTQGTTNTRQKIFLSFSFARLFDPPRRCIKTKVEFYFLRFYHRIFVFVFFLQIRFEKSAGDFQVRRKHMHTHPSTRLHLNKTVEKRLNTRKKKSS